MNRKNRIGETREPCGSPQHIVARGERSPSNTISINRPVVNEVTKPGVLASLVATSCAGVCFLGSSRIPLGRSSLKGQPRAPPDPGLYHTADQYGSEIHGKALGSSSSLISTQNAVLHSIVHDFSGKQSFQAFSHTKKLRSAHRLWE